MTRQLFDPLVIQLIHWFTQNLQKDNDETMALLDAITNALGHFENASLRDYAGKCMAEFVKWSLKHHGSSRGALNIRSLLRRVYALLKHPSPHKRLGACLTFHYVYRNVELPSPFFFVTPQTQTKKTQLREERKSVSLFVLEILMQLVDALAISHHDISSVNTTYVVKWCMLWLHLFPLCLRLLLFPS